MLDKLWGADIHVRPSGNTASWYRHITLANLYILHPSESKWCEHTQLKVI